MKIRASAFIPLTFLLTLNVAVYCIGQVEYTICVYSDGSATWTLILISESNFSYADENFRGNLTELVEEAENKTGREMDVRIEEIYIVPQDTYMVVKYIICWENFCEVENSKLVVGDVFQVDDFFSKLYGDGVVYLTYPPEYFVETVSPRPDEQDDQHQMLKWFKAELLSAQTTSIVLTRRTSGFLEFLQQNVVPIVSLIVIASGSSIVFYLLRRKRKAEESLAKPLFPPLLEMEDDEEKVVRTLKNSGGSLYQSQISEKCGFSRAKTSQLLKLMERKGILERRKKGRGKIVTLIKKVGEKE